MPTGVPLTTPAAPCSALLDAVGDPRLPRPRKLRGERFGLARDSVSKMRSSATSRLASAKAIALPTPPAPISATAPCPGCADQRRHRARKAGGVGVVADQPAVATTTVLTAPIAAAPGASSSSSGDHRFLVGEGDVDAGEAEPPHAVEQHAQASSRRRRRPRSAGNGSARRAPRRPARASRATRNARSARRSGRSGSCDLLAA